MEKLVRLLRERLSIISDRAFCERDPDRHLAALQQVSESIIACHLTLRDAGQLTPRLEHFLSNCSFDKALELAENRLK